MPDANEHFDLDRIFEKVSIATRRAGAFVAVIEDLLRPDDFKRLSLGARHGVQVFPHDTNNDTIEAVASEIRRQLAYSAFLDLIAYFEGALEDIVWLTEFQELVERGSGQVSLSLLQEAKLKHRKWKKSSNLEGKIVIVEQRICGEIDAVAALKSAVPIRNAIVHNFGFLERSHIKGESHHTLKWLAIVPFVSGAAEEVSMRHGSVIDTENLTNKEQTQIIIRTILNERIFEVGTRIDFGCEELLELAVSFRMSAQGILAKVVEWARTKDIIDAVDE